MPGKTRKIRGAFVRRLKLPDPQSLNSTVCRLRSAMAPVSCSLPGQAVSPVATVFRLHPAATSAILSSSRQADPTPLEGSSHAFPARPTAFVPSASGGPGDPHPLVRPHGGPAHRYSGQGLLTPSQEWPILRTGTHGQVPGLPGHPADNYESTCFGQGSGNSGLCA